MFPAILRLLPTFLATPSGVTGLTTEYLAGSKWQSEEKGIFHFVCVHYLKRKRIALHTCYKLSTLYIALKNKPRLFFFVFLKQGQKLILLYLTSSFRYRNGRVVAAWDPDECTSEKSDLSSWKHLEGKGHSWKLNKRYYDKQHKEVL